MQTGHVKHVGFGFFTDHVHHFVNGDPADQLFVFIDNRRGDQVITFKRLRRFFHVVFGTKAHDIGGHYVRHHVFGVGDQEFADGQHTLQHVVFIDHENLVGMVGQAVETAQVAQYDFTRHIGADADQFKVHNRADLVVFVRHRRFDLLAFFFITRLQRFVHHLVRQVVCQLCQFVCVQIIDGGQQLVFVHGLDQRFAYGVGYFQQHFAVVFRGDQKPNNVTLARRQGFQDGGHVGGVQPGQEDGQLGELVAQAFVFNRHACFDLFKGRLEDFA